MGNPSCCLCACIFRIILGILNLIILLAGLLVAGIGGILIAVSQGSLTHAVQGIILSVIDTGSPDPQGSVENSPQQEDPVAAQTDLTQLMRSTGIALVVIGGTMVGIALFGYCGGIFTAALKIYAVLLLIIVVVEIILVALLFSGTFNPYMKDAANQTLVDHYVDLTDKGIYSMIWNLAMIKSGCCGLTGYTDFHYTRNSWPRNVTVKSKDDSVTVTRVTPLACCRTTGQFPKVVFVVDQCAITPDSNNSNFMTGCWDKVSQDLNLYRVGIIIGISVAIVIEVVIALMALFVARNSNKISPI